MIQGTRFCASAKNRTPKMASLRDSVTVLMLNLYNRWVSLFGRIRLSNPLKHIAGVAFGSGLNVIGFRFFPGANGGSKVAAFLVSQAQARLGMRIIQGCALRHRVVKCLFMGAQGSA